MAESLLNLGGAIQNMIGLAQLGQMRERTALIQQDREIEKARLDLADKRYDQQLNQDQTQNLLRVAEHPLHANTPVGVAAIREVMRRNNSPITEEEAAVGFEAFVGLAKAKADRTMPQAEREKAAYKAMTYAPSLSKQFLESADKWEGMDARHQKIANELLLQEGKLRELNTKHVSALLNKGVYSTISGFMNQLVETTQVKDAQGTRALGPTFQKIMSSNDEKERTILRHSVKDLDGKMQQQVLGLSASFDEFYTRANERLRPEVEAIESAQAQGREVDDAELGKVKALELLDASKDAVEKWAAQPYDKQAWTRLQNTMRQVNQAAAGSKKELSNLDGIRTGMLENATRRVDLAVDKDARVALNEQATGVAAREYIKNLNQGMKENRAAEAAMEMAGVRVPGGIVDTGKLINPEKKGVSKFEFTASPGERDTIAKGRASLGDVAEVESLYSSKFVGKYDNFAAKLKGPLDLLSEDEAQFRADVGKMGAELKKFYAGTAQSQHELKQLVDAIPSTSMSEGQFKASIKATKNNVRRKLREQVAVIEESGGRAPSAEPTLSPARRKAFEYMQQKYPEQAAESVQRFLSEIPDKDLEKIMGEP